MFCWKLKHYFYPRIILDWIAEQQKAFRNLLVLWKINFYLKNSRLLLVLCLSLFKKSLFKQACFSQKNSNNNNLCDIVI